MTDRLTDERVREIASGVPAFDTATESEAHALAREVVALREELGEANAVLAKGNDGFVRQVQQFAEWKAKGDALIATLTAQRDEAVAIAREIDSSVRGLAVEGYRAWDQDNEPGNAMRAGKILAAIGGTSGLRPKLDALRARLAQIGGE